MTSPRQVLRGTTYFLTRRCSQRQFLLRPDPVTNQLFDYVLAHTAALHGILLHAYCVMSNHYHLVLTDPRAELPAFMQRLDGVLARALNALRGRREHFWNSEGYHALPLESAADVIHWSSYALANPVAAGLVRRARRWPGRWSRPSDIGSRRSVERPTHFFDQTRQEAKVVELALSAPPGFGSAKDFRRALEAALRTREREAAERRADFQGARRVLTQNPLARPSSREQFRKPVPKAASKDPELRRAHLRRLRSFLETYAEALERWRERRRLVVFPDGTYLMRVAHGVACAGAG